MRLIREFEAQAKSTGIINLDFANEGGDAHKISVTADSFGDAGNDLSLAVDFIDQLPGAYHQASASGFAAFADVDVDLRDDMIQLIRFQANAVGPAANGTRVIVRHDANLADNTAGTTLDGTTHILGINGTRTLTQLVAAFNAATETGWAVTASLVDSSQGGDTVEWLGGGVQAAVIYRLFSDAFLSFTAKDPGSDGNGIGSSSGGDPATGSRSATISASAACLSPCGATAPVLRTSRRPSTPSPPSRSGRRRSAVDRPPIAQTTTGRSTYRATTPRGCAHRAARTARPQWRRSNWRSARRRCRD